MEKFELSKDDYSKRGDTVQAYLKKNKNLAIAPFDRGKGIVSLERDKLIEKATAEFKNTTMDTPNKTVKYERKIQNKSIFSKWLY